MKKSENNLATCGESTYQGIRQCAHANGNCNKQYLEALLDSIVLLDKWTTSRVEYTFGSLSVGFERSEISAPTELAPISTARLCREHIAKSTITT